MTMLAQLSRVAAATLLVLAVAAGSAEAGKRKHGHGHGHHGHGGVTILIEPYAFHGDRFAGHGHGGPPPWAPAHGYRRRHGHGHAYLLDTVDMFAVPRFDLGGCNRDAIGLLLGAAAGGLAGAHIGDGSGRLAAVGAGVLLGGLLGREVGASLERMDPACAGRFLETVPPYRPVEWWNPDGVAYRMMPSEPYADHSGRYCREYQTRAAIGGQVQQMYGTACRQPDGQWQLMN